MEQFKIYSLLSCILTMSLSMLCIVSTSLLLNMRHDCHNPELLGRYGSDYMWFLLIKKRIMDKDCMDEPDMPKLAKTHSVLIFTILSLICAMASFISGTMLLISTNIKRCKKFVSWAMFSHIFWYLSSFCVDSIFAMTLGIDYLKLSESMNSTFTGIPSTYEADELRFSTLMAALLVMKSIIAPIINLSLLGLMLLSITEFMQTNSQEETSPEATFPMWARNTTSSYNVRDMFQMFTNTAISTITLPVMPVSSVRVPGAVEDLAQPGLERPSITDATPQLRAPITEYPRRVSRSTIPRPILPGPSFSMREDIAFITNAEFELASTSSASPQFRQQFPTTVPYKADEFTIPRPIRSGPSIFASERVTFISNRDVDTTSTSSADYQQQVETEV